MLGINVNDIGNIIDNSQSSQWHHNNYNDALKKIMEKGLEKNSSLLYDGGLFSCYFSVIKRYLPELPEKTLEVGPGWSIGASVLLAINGIKEANTLDPFPNLNFDIAHFVSTLQTLINSTFFIRQLSSCPTEGGFQGAESCGFSVPESKMTDTNKFQIGKNIVNHYAGRFLEDTGLDGNTYDFIFSHAALEHVRSPEICVKELRHILKIGGVTAHQIDLRDHRDFSKPLEFLKESEESWQKIMTEMCEHDGSIYMNRWRKSQWINAFRENGFYILEADANMKLEQAAISEISSCLDERYKDIEHEDLESISLFLVARRVA